MKLNSSGLGIHAQIADGAVSHHIPPGSHVTVHQEGEAESEGAAVSDQNGVFAWVRCSDPAKGSGVAFGDLPRGLSATGGVVRLLAHALEEAVLSR